MDNEEDELYNFRSLKRIKTRSIVNQPIETIKLSKKTRVTKCNSLSEQVKKSIIKKNVLPERISNVIKLSPTDQNSNEIVYEEKTQNDKYVTAHNTCRTPRTPVMAVGILSSSLCKQELTQESSTLRKIPLAHLNEDISTVTEPPQFKDDIITGRCPFCQMPFQILKVQSPNWHTMECMDIPFNATQECPAGLICDNTIPSHYRRFKHTLLAFHFAGRTPLDRDKEDTEFVVTKTTFVVKGSDSVHRKTSDSVHRKTSDSLHRKTNDSVHRKTRSITTINKGMQKRKRDPDKKSVNSFQVKQVCLNTSSETELSQSQGSQSSSHSSNSIKDYLIINGEKWKSDQADNDIVSTDFSLEQDSNSDTYREVRITEDATENSTCLEQDSQQMTNNIAREEIFHQHSSLGGFFLETDIHLSSEVLTFIDKNLPQRDVMKDVENRDVQKEKLIKSSADGEHLLETVSDRVTPIGVQKQTSLFSFFKPRCHSSAQGTPCSTNASQKTNMCVDLLQINDIPDISSEPKQVLSASASEPLMSLHIQPPPSLSFQLVQKQKASCLLKKGGYLPVSASEGKEKDFPNQKSCPFYKKIPGTAITVDAFSYGIIPGCQAYILTHFHSDHYQGLTKRFNQPVFCSSVTGNLVEKQIGIASHFIHRLPLNKPCQVTGIQLTLMEANHCPGAVIILFELPNGKKILHTGDFRADPSMEVYAPIMNIAVDELYLDTTYCNPAYAFPSQRETIQFAVKTALKEIERESRTLVVCGAYTIGKERVFIALAEALQTKVCVQAHKKRLLDCLEDEQLKKLVSLRLSEGRVHVLPMMKLNPKGLEEHLTLCPEFSSVLAFEPTGWTHNKKAIALDNIRPKYSRHGITIYGVPYSEHSSYLELKRFVQFLHPKKIIPTVNNGSATSRSKMEATFRQWMSESTNDFPNHCKDLPQRSLGTWLKK